MFKKKTKALILVMAAVFIFGSIFSGCGTKSEPAADKNDAKQEAPKTEAPKDEKTYTFKMGHVLPTDHLNHLGSEHFAKLVNEKTGGKVTIEIYPAAQLGSEKDHSDAVAMGTLDFALIGMGEIAKRYKPALIFDGPFIFRDRDHLINVFKSDLFAKMADESAAKAGIRPIGGTYYGTRHVTTSKVAAKTPEELKGLKLRCPDQPMFVGVVKAMGATPAPMAFSEVYLALQQGVVDGQENPAAAITSMKFFEVQKYLIKTGHIAQGNHIFVSEKVFKTLPEDIQKAILEAGQETADWVNEQAFALEDKLLKELVEKGMTIVEPDREAFIKAAQPLYDEYESQWGEGLLEDIRAIK
ncbi:sialic acid TRAP transporter substrate-binding protein SiaP [Petroclostridium sp. X23]|uniref:sialic acid TRAP transporter substrate-binding protein SiaP n=1 Tax=Petroclostridium sp. X23 TaxID=3045146 RepID=UPI0024ADE7AF|nr:sialic acid TRAP transporter substrate-binding protein SiaP [Petroclostridium sp. X23]WHH59081.1 sialic acid TRAP transporter substrate-binding protein SiaP [Petroclostridium sp. X23]